MKDWIGGVRNAWTQQRDQAFWCGGMVAGRSFAKAAVKKNPRINKYDYTNRDNYISYLVTEGGRKELPVEGDEILWLFDNGYTFSCNVEQKQIVASPPKDKSLTREEIKMGFYSDRGLGSKPKSIMQDIEGAKAARRTRLTQLLLGQGIFRECFTFATEGRLEEKPSFERQFLKFGS